MALKGIKVLEFVGLAPGPLCGKILSDFGATVTRIDRVYENHLDVTRTGKRTLAVNLKESAGQQLIRDLTKQYDVLIDPFRPGIMEKLNLGPDVLCTDNTRLIYARLTGFGQSGPLAPRAGHDINYVAYSGVLSMLRYMNGKPFAPLNLAADFAGGAVMCALGICVALLERYRSGRGQVVDAAMVEGAAYVASWMFMARNLPLWEMKTFEGGCYYYDTYETKDGKFMSVGALEPKFFEIFKEKLGLPQLDHFVVDEVQQKEMRNLLETTFRQKTQFEWSEIFNDTDACVYPVIAWDDVMSQEQHQQRKSFDMVENLPIPRPAPRLSRTPGQLKKSTPYASPIDEAIDILKDIGIGPSDFKRLTNSGTILMPQSNSKL